VRQAPQARCDNSLSGLTDSAAEHVVRHLRGSAAMEQHLPLPLHEAVSAFKRQLVLDVLEHFSGNRSRAAAALKIERTSLLRLIRELEIAELVPGHRGRPSSRR
jgi:DNA-binding NtrC family response regulator